MMLCGSCLNAAIRSEPQIDFQKAIAVGIRDLSAARKSDLSFNILTFLRSICIFRYESDKKVGELIMRGV
jgi:hypothetical protein